MQRVSERIGSFIDDPRAPLLLAKYYSGRYTGALFDHAPQLQSPDANRFTTQDIAAVATLSVPLSGRAVQGLLEREAELSGLLEAIPHDADLAVADDQILEDLYKLQDALDKVHDIGHVTRSKLLAHKRPHLVPIRDQHVLNALTGRTHGDFTEPLRQALRHDEAIIPRLLDLQHRAAVQPVSALRALDVVVWMAVHGDAQVSD